MTEEKNVVCGPPDVDIPEDMQFSDFLFDSLKSGGNNIAAVDGGTGNKMTYAEILQKSVNLAISLRKLKFKKHDVTAICSENRFEFTISTFAVMLNGGMVAPMNVTYSTDELKHAFGISKPKYVFCSPDTAAKVKEVSSAVKCVKKIILFGKDDTINATLYDKLVSKDQDVGSFETVKVDQVNDVIAILMSSGTTGLPKGVMLTHRNYLVCACHVKAIYENFSRETTAIMLVTPWSHSYGFMMQTALSSARYRFVFSPRFEERLFLKIIQDQKITFLAAVPPLLIFLAKSPLVDEYDLSSLQMILCGSAPVSKDILERVTKRLKLQSVGQGFTMTEMSLAVLRTAPGIKKIGSVGRVAPGTKAKIFDMQTGESLGPNREGEMCFKGPLIMKGYIGDAASAENAFDGDGWLHTGDVGYYDRDGDFFIVDRIKELIKYKGFQVPPAELEALLLQHPDVNDAGVVPLPDEAAGELPLAYVVKKPGSAVTAQQLMDFVAAKVSPAKRLRGGVRFIRQIPKNPSGKILRRELKKLNEKPPSSKL